MNFYVSIHCISYLLSEVPLGLIHLFIYMVNLTNKIEALIVNLQTSS
jgi:hypothetical protein